MKKNSNCLMVILSVLLGVFIVLSCLFGFIVFTNDNGKCAVVESGIVDGNIPIELNIADVNVRELFGMVHGPYGMGLDWSMYKPGKTLTKDMDYDYKLYVASIIYGNAVITYNYPNNQYRMELKEEFVKNAVDLVFGTGVYKKTDRVPYLCGILFWDNAKNIYFSDNLGCGGRLGTSHNEEIIKAEKFSDRIEITSAVGFTVVEGAIYKDSEFKEVADERINISTDELNKIIKTNSEKFYNYKYTFKLNDSGFYNYYSIERIN